MTDFHHKVNKFCERFAKCDPCLEAKVCVHVSFFRGPFTNGEFFLSYQTVTLVCQNLYLYAL